MPEFRNRVTGKLNSAASSALAFRIDSDTQYRIDVDAGGKITWGPGGSTSGDTTLYRSSADLLKTDDAFQAALGVITLTTSGAPATSLADGAIAVDTTNHNFYYRSGSTWRTISTTETLTFTIPGNLVVGTGQARWYAQRAITISNVRVSVGTAPTGSSAIFDVNRNGTTIFSTQVNRPTVAVSGFTDLSSVPDTTSIASGEYITIDVDQIGSSTAGANAVIQIDYS